MKLIDKDKIVEEIERRIAAITDMCDESKHPQFTLYGKINALENLLPFLDTLEVKEVDLEKEYDRYYEQERYIQTFKLAKHFFELGLKAQKGE